MRSLKKAVEQGRAIARKRERLDLGSYEAQVLKNIFDEQPDYNGLLELIINSYYFGLAVGYRNA